MPDLSDAERLAKQLAAGAGPEEHEALLAGLVCGQVSSIVERRDARDAPSLLPVPAAVRGFRLRLELLDTEPPVWRRVELPGDLTLPLVHHAIQAVMGWSNSHLHRFRTGGDYSSPSFVTAVDLDEGEDGTLEDDVRLDQLVSQPGDALWYEYDFGDGWEHELVVEDVLEVPPAPARCTGGELACPPEDCGGLGGYEELAAWVRSGYQNDLLPDAFEDAASAYDWLPPDWDPDRFSVDRADAALAATLSEPVAVDGELAALADQLEHRGVRLLRDVLARPLSHGATEVTDVDAARLTETFRILLDVVGEGVRLTSAGYLPPSAVEQFAERSGITAWWIGKANREDLTPPVAQVRDAARALGLVIVRKGRLSPTAAAARADEDPQRLLQHIVERLPLGTKDGDRQSGWMALAVVASGAPAEEWAEEIGDLLHALGWRSGYQGSSRPPTRSPTLDVLRTLGGATRARWGGLVGVDLALAATARAALRLP